MDRSIQGILLEAWRWEQDSYELYSRAVEYTNDEKVKSLLKWLAAEEVIHKRKIEELMSEESGSPSEFNFDLPVHSPPKLTEEALSDILILAREREEKAYREYSSQAKKVTHEKVRDLLEWLAKEELKHKRRIEDLLCNFSQEG